TSADLDGNGLADLVTSMTNGGLLGVRLQTSPGVFSAESTLKPLPAWSGVVGPPGFGDLDGDGALDGVLFVNGQLVPLSGDGHGALAAATPLEAGFYSGLPIVADMDFDGRADVFVGRLSKNLDGGLTEVCRGDGQGAVLQAPRVTLGPSAAHGLAAADMDGDGIADLAAALGDANTR